MSGGIVISAVRPDEMTETTDRSRGMRQPYSLASAIRPTTAGSFIDTTAVISGLRSIMSPNVSRPA